MSLKRVQAFLEAEEARRPTHPPAHPPTNTHPSTHPPTRPSTPARSPIVQSRSGSGGRSSGSLWSCHLAEILPRCRKSQVEPRELLAPPPPPQAPTSAAASTAAVNTQPAAVEITGGHFAWGDDGAAAPLRGAELRVAAGELVCLVGQVGCGKSSLLHAVLGELRPLRGSRARAGGDVAFCAQTAFIVNGTIETNILFGRPMDRERYRRVVFAAALEPDFRELVRSEGRNYHPKSNSIQPNRVK